MCPPASSRIQGTGTIDLRASTTIIFLRVAREASVVRSRYHCARALLLPLEPAPREPH